MRINQENRSVDIERRDINYILPSYVRSYLFFTKGEMPEKITFPMFQSIVYQGKEIPIEYIPPTDPVAIEIAKDGADIPEVTPEEEAALDEKDEEIRKLKEQIADLEKILPSGVASPHDAMATPEDLTKQEEEALPATIDEAMEDVAEAGLKRVEDMSIEEPVSPARAAFAESAEESIHKVEKERYEAEGERVDAIAEQVKETAEEPKSESDNATESVPPTSPPPAPSVDREPKQPPGGDVGPGLPLSDTHPRDRRDQGRTARDLKEEPEIDEDKVKEYEKPITRDEQGRPVVEEPDASD